MSDRSTPDDDPKLTVYFDGSCPLCVREIGFFEKRTDETVDYVDVSNPEFNASSDLSRDKAMARFHVRDEAGVLHDGAGAFFVLWEKMAALRPVVRIMRVLKLTGPANWAYDKFLRLRPYLQKVVRRYDKAPLEGK